MRNERLEKITQDYKNGHMLIVDIGWLIAELKESKNQINDLEECSQIWIKRSLEDSKKLIEANARIKELENRLSEKWIVGIDLTKKAPYDDPND